MNPLGITFWNWTPALGPECLGLSEKIKSMGFTSLEVPMTSPEVDEALAEEIRRSGLTVTLCASLGPGMDLSSFDEGERAAAMDYLTRCLITGEKLGARVLGGPLYTGGGKRHRLPPEEKQREWDLAAEGLRELARRAADRGVRLAVEPLHRYRTSVVNTSAQALALARDAGGENVGVLFDTYHAALEEADLLGALDAALATGRVYHFHACATNRGAPGDGIMPWDAVMDRLRLHGYGGCITMETFAPGGLDSSFVHVHGAPDELARRGLRYLKNYFASHDPACTDQEG